jgi:hypothetical protein
MLFVFLELYLNIIWLHGDDIVFLVAIKMFIYLMLKNNMHIRNNDDTTGQLSFREKIKDNQGIFVVVFIKEIKGCFVYSCKHRSAIWLKRHQKIKNCFLFSSYMNACQLTKRLCKKNYM